MVNLFSDKAQCCGCTACASVCPKGAISMTADESGFYYPNIDAALCVECGTCTGVCAFKNSGKPDGGKAEVYAAINKAEQRHIQGSSGGVFIELAEAIISDGGKVYGVVFDEAFRVCHSRAEVSEQVGAMTGSKYVQSSLDGIFASVKDDLNSGKKVLFSGTGCQVDGLKSYLKKDYEKLFTIDIICHGVASPKMFDDYKARLEKKYSSKIKSYNFRAKKIKGEIQDIEAVFENGKIYSQYPDMDDFRSLYSKELAYRPSCYNCRYACENRVGDITLGDFWGIEKTMPEFKSRYGNSLVIVSTDKGKALLDCAKNSFELRKADINAASQPSLKACVKKSAEADRFMKEYAENGFDFVCKKYNSVSPLKKIKRKIKQVL